MSCDTLDSCNFVQVVNPAIGDSMSGLLLVAAILKCTRMTATAWADLYTPCASRLTTVSVRDRHALETQDMETRVKCPAGLQHDIDALVASVQQGRSFVRPSGTEDVVRVYAEAASQRECDALCQQVEAAVRKHLSALE